MSGTFTDTMRREARETNRLPWAFGQAMVRASLEEDLVAGLRAFAQLWFMELTEEKALPEEFNRLVELVERNWLADLAELDDDEEGT